MNGFLRRMDRWRVVEGIIIIILALLVPHTHGVAEYAALIIAAALLIVLYSWWRRKGIFANRR
jgi:O-antigen/teichoic acid export membrane protein